VPPPVDAAPPDLTAPPDMAVPLPPCELGSTAAEIETALFVPKCTAACHGPGSPLSKLDLVSAGVAGRVLGQATDGTASGMCKGRVLVDRASPLDSLFLEKVEQTQPSCGAAMPLGGLLPPGELSCVRRWLLLIAR
jgi:hypothetical protein